MAATVRGAPLWVTAPTCHVPAASGARRARQVVPPSKKAGTRRVLPSAAVHVTCTSLATQSNGLPARAGSSKLVSIRGHSPGALTLPASNRHAAQIIVTLLVARYSR